MFNKSFEIIILKHNILVKTRERILIVRHFLFPKRKCSRMYQSFLRFKAFSRVFSVILGHFLTFFLNFDSYLRSFQSFCLFYIFFKNHYVRSHVRQSYHVFQRSNLNFSKYVKRVFVTFG